MDGALVDYLEGRSNALLNTHKYMIKIASIIMFPRGGGGGGGYLGTECIPTAKRPPGAEAVNVKIKGRSVHFWQNKGRSSTN